MIFSLLGECFIGDFYLVVVVSVSMKNDNNSLANFSVSYHFRNFARDSESVTSQLLNCSVYSFMIGVMILTLIIVKILLIVHLCGSQSLNEECVKENERCICKYEADCAHAIRAARFNEARHRFTVARRCGFDGIRIIVCCPIKRISQFECEKFLKRPKRIISLDPHIVGKSDLAEYYEFPQYAALSYKKKEMAEFGCGGVLISSNFVLTAAHCFGTQTRVIFVRLGTRNMASAMPNKKDVDVKVIFIKIYKRSYKIQKLIFRIQKFPESVSASQL